MRTISRHLLRRTARAREAEIKRLQAVATKRGGVREVAQAREAQLRLERIGARMSDKIEVVSYVRGPFGFRVVAR